jgi:hypothetical protein
MGGAADADRAGRRRASVGLLASDPVNGHLALDYHAELSDEGILVIDGSRDFRRPLEISYLSLPIIPESRVLRLFSAVPGPDELLHRLRRQQV